MSFHDKAINHLVNSTSAHLKYYSPQTFCDFLITLVMAFIAFVKFLLVRIFHSFKDNSLQEWSYKSAVTIQTYDGYDPIPVPLNIIYSVAKLLRLVEKKEEENV